MATSNDIQSKILSEIQRERAFQDAKWGTDRILPIETWREILQEELYEALDSAIESDAVNYLGELIQSASVIVAWAESEAMRLQIDVAKIQARAESGDTKGRTKNR